MVNTYPYGSNDRLVGPTLNNEFELSAGVVPPSGMAGGAGQFKLWMDTSVNPQPALRIVTAARAMAGVYVPSEWGLLGRLDLNTRQFQYQGTWGGDLTVSGNIAATGSVFGTNFYLSGPMIFFNGNTNSGLGPRLYVDNTTFVVHLGPGNGSLSVLNSSSTTVASIDGSGNFNGKNINLTQSYIQFAGSTGTVNTTSGPLIYADPTSQVFKLGSGNGNWLFQNYAGAIVANLSSGGNLNSIGQLAANTINASSTINAVQYNLSGGPFAVNNGTATVIYDNTGAPAIHLWPAITYYDADTHHFRNNAGSEIVTVDSTGALYSIGNIHSGQALYLGNPFILFNNNTGLTQGPYIQADNADWIFRRGPGVGKFFFTNSDGGVVLSIDGGGSVIVTGYMLSLGYQTRAGIAGGGTGNHFNIEWRPGAHLWVDNADQGLLVVDGGGGISTSNGFTTTGPNGGSTFQMVSTAGYSYIRFLPNWYWEFNASGDSSSGAMVWFIDRSGPKAFWYMRASDSMCLNYLGPVAGLGAYVNTSDRRGKKNIAPSHRGLAEILELTPVEFDRISDVDTHREIGFIAQDVKDVMPEAVRVVGITLPDGTGGLEDAEPSLGLTDSTIVAALVNAVKELHTRLEAIEASA